MLRPAVAVAALVCALTIGIGGFAVAAEQREQQDSRMTRAVVIRDPGGDVLASLPLRGDSFAVGYRNSIYGTLAEERYVAEEGGSYRLTEIAADQQAVLEEYYAVPGAPTRAPAGDRRDWVAGPDPRHPAVFEKLSIAATDLGERTLHVPGSAPLALWRLVDDDSPFVSLDISLDILDIKETH